MEYIYYRVYLAYQRKGDAAILLSPLYMAIVYALIFSPIAMFIIELLTIALNRYHA